MYDHESINTLVTTYRSVHLKHAAACPQQDDTCHMIVAKSAGGRGVTVSSAIFAPFACDDTLGSSAGMTVFIPVYVVVLLMSAKSV